MNQITNEANQPSFGPNGYIIPGAKSAGMPKETLAKLLQRAEIRNAGDGTVEPLPCHAQVAANVMTPKRKLKLRAVILAANALTLLAGVLLGIAYAASWLAAKAVRVCMVAGRPLRRAHEALERIRSVLAPKPLIFYGQVQDLNKPTFCTADIIEAAERQAGRTVAESAAADLQRVIEKINDSSPAPQVGSAPHFSKEDLAKLMGEVEAEILKLTQEAYGSKPATLQDIIAATTKETVVSGTNLSLNGPLLKAANRTKKPTKKAAKKAPKKVAKKKK